jgi:hypothetical protein
MCGNRAPARLEAVMKTAAGVVSAALLAALAGFPTAVPAEQVLTPVKVTLYPQDAPRRLKYRLLRSSAIAFLATRRSPTAKSRRAERFFNDGAMRQNIDRWQVAPSGAPGAQVSAVDQLLLRQAALASLRLAFRLASRFQRRFCQKHEVATIWRIWPPRLGSTLAAILVGGATYAAVLLVGRNVAGRALVNGLVGIAIWVNVEAGV